jgi:hypothetical protein
MSPNRFLRLILSFDAASCLGLGLIAAVGAKALSPLLGLSAGLLSAAALLLLPLGLFVAWLASRSEPPRPLVWALIAGNVLWTAESFFLIGQSEGAITALGSAFVAGQALAVLGLALLEYAGLRKVHVAATA